MVPREGPAPGAACNRAIFNHMSRWTFLLWACLLVVLVVPDTAASGARRVLVLHSFGRDFGPFHVFSTEFRTALSRASPQPIDFQELTLEIAPGGGREGEDALRKLVQAIQVTPRPSMRCSRWASHVYTSKASAESDKAMRARLSSGTAFSTSELK